MNDNSKMAPLQVPLVGAHFRPPAKQVIAHLPSEARLVLRPEPENPYDAKAIKVFGLMSEVPETMLDDLNLALDGTGHELADLLDQKEVWLGYIGDSDGKLCKGQGLPGNREVAEMAHAVIGEAWTEAVGRLSFLPDGKPAVTVTSDEIAPVPFDAEQNG